MFNLLILFKQPDISFKRLIMSFVKKIRKEIKTKENQKGDQKEENRKEIKTRQAERKFKQ